MGPKGGTQGSTFGPRALFIGLEFTLSSSPI